VLFKIEKLRS